MKYAIIIPDGAADEPLKELGGKTPLEAADIPNMDRIAMEAARDAMRDARTDEFQATGIPADATWRRSALLDQNTCGPCMDADGAEIDGPDDDLSEICEGNEACRCVPYCDLTE